MLTIWILAISLSIDAFGIGTAYGMKKINIPIYARTIISLISACVTFLSICLGEQLQKILPSSFANAIGIFILIFIGIYMITMQNPDDNKKNECLPKKKQSVRSIFIKSLGITIKIIREPQLADLNKSKKIEAIEAICIGIALSIDSIGIGIGISVLGYNNFLIPLAVAICQFLFLSIGILSGKLFLKNNLDNKKIAVLSGCILIIIAVIRIF